MDEVLVRTIALACPVEHAFDVFTDKIDLWWPRGHRRNRDASLTLTGEALIERVEPSLIEMRLEMRRAVGLSRLRALGDLLDEIETCLGAPVRPSRD